MPRKALILGYLLGWLAALEDFPELADSRSGVKRLRFATISLPASVWKPCKAGAIT